MHGETIKYKHNNIVRFAMIFPATKRTVSILHAYLPSRAVEVLVKSTSHLQRPFTNRL